MIIAAETDTDKAAVLKYVADKIGVTPEAIIGTMPYSAIVAVNDNRMAAGAVYTNHRGISVEMSVGGENGLVMPEHIIEMFNYPFLQLGVYTLLTLVKRSNEYSRGMNERLGFELMGIIESGVPENDVFQYKMTRPNCKWIKQP